MKSNELQTNLNAGFQQLCLERAIARTHNKKISASRQEAGRLSLMRYPQAYWDTANLKLLCLS